MNVEWLSGVLSDLCEFCEANGLVNTAESIAKADAMFRLEQLENRLGGDPDTSSSTERVTLKILIDANSAAKRMYG